MGTDDWNEPEDTDVDHAAAAHAAELAIARATIEEAQRHVLEVERQLGEERALTLRLRNENSRLVLALSERRIKPAIER